MAPETGWRVLEDGVGGSGGEHLLSRLPGTVSLPASGEKETCVDQRDVGWI